MSRTHRLELPAGGQLLVSEPSDGEPWELTYVPRFRKGRSAVDASITSADRPDMPVGEKFEPTVIRDWWLREFPEAR
jgi:hypothetical protein